MDFNGGGDTSFEDVQTLLDSDLDNFNNELDALYTQMERYSRTADVMESTGRSDDAQYFQKLAADTYDSFVTAIQMKKLPEEEDDEYNF